MLPFRLSRSSIATAPVAIVLVAVSAVLLALLTPGAARADGPDHHRPSAGECYELSATQAARASVSRTLRTDCATEHTSQVTAVLTPPSSLDLADGAAVYRFAARSCFAGLARTVGGTDRTRALAQFQMRLFVPTAGERDKGARWVSCHVVLPAVRVLEQLPTDGDPQVGQEPLDDAVAKCVTSRNYYTPCARGHAFRATGAFRVDDKRFPSSDRLGRIAQRRCPALTTGSGWRFAFVGQPAFRAGQRHMVCFTRTSD